MRTGSARRNRVLNPEDLRRSVLHDRCCV